MCILRFFADELCTLKELLHNKFYEDVNSIILCSVSWKIYFNPLKSLHKTIFSERNFEVLNGKKIFQNI